MTPQLAVVRGGNRFTKVTEEFLLNQPDVLDASVWMSDGRLMSHVTLSDSSAWTERALRVACAREIGLEYTPSEIVLMGARIRVA